MKRAVSVKNPEIKTKEECKCKEPELAFEYPSMKSDGTYFNYCKKCKNFRDVPKPRKSK
jgi:hypothetical protein